MNRKDLVEALAKKTGKSKADAEQAVSILFDSISEALASGDSVSLTGFGSFSISERSARQGRNPKTGETIQIAAKRTPAFKPGATLKKAVNSK